MIRAALGGTVNDVVLAAITAGFRELLLSRGEPADGVVRTMVPVSVRAPGERGTYNNRVSAIFADLPVGLTDPADRLRAITVQLDGLKQSRQTVAGEVLCRGIETGVAELVAAARPGPPARRAARRKAGGGTGPRG